MSADAIRFTVMGDPKGKGRPRFKRSGNGIVTFTPPETAAYELRVAQQAKRAMGSRMALTGPVSVSLYIVFGIPRTATKARREQMIAGDIHPRKIDIDNICKAFLDGAQGVAFENDADVICLSASKRYGAEPYVTMVIEPMSQEAIAEMREAA